MNCKELFGFLICLFKNPFCIHHHVSNDSLLYSTSDSDSDEDLLGSNINL